MPVSWKVRPAAVFAALLLVAAAGSIGNRGLVSSAVASDHQDTPEVELNPRCDINDVYAFPGSTNDRIVLVMTTSSPIGTGAAASFDNDKLYQLKIDNDDPSDGVEDLVLQFTFSGSGASQTVTLRGPVAPVNTGTANKLSPASPAVSGTVGTNLGSASDIQLFAGLRDDPFYLDLERFFRIIPDRKPVTGDLSQLPDTPTESCFRSPGIDYLAGFNTLAIVVELPESRLTQGTGTRLGIWGTISR
jgi:hypothetical protein